ERGGAEGIGPSALRDRVTEGLLDPSALGTERLELEAGAGLQEREHTVGVIAQRLAEVGAAVAGGARVDERLEHEVLLLGLAPEEDGVVAEADVMDDVGVELLHLENRRRHVVERRPVVVLE